LITTMLLAAASIVLAPGTTLAAAAKAQRTRGEVTTVPGGLLRWAGTGTTRCSMQGRRWAPVDDICYYGIDLEQKPGVVVVRRDREGRHESMSITVEPRNYGTQDVTLPDIPQAHPSAADVRRDARERVLLGKVFNRRESERQFALPLGKAADPFPPGKSFGVDRIFNGKPAPQAHTGTDYPVPPGSPVLAVADGTVLLARDLFYPGNAVFIDHGDGLVSMYFHLSEIAAREGDAVKKGDRIGAVGSTGRATGPHLFFGVRWHNARIDPKFLLQDPARIPDIGDVAVASSRTRSARP
jgi:hypothetical protein